MANHDPVQRSAGGARNTLLVDPSNPAHAALVAQMPGWRAVSIDEAIGRDLIESRWVCVADWRLFERMEHLRELCWQRRGGTSVVVGLSAEAIGPEGVRCLRRFAGEAIALAGSGSAGIAGQDWMAQLLVPVTSVGRDGLVPAIEAAALRNPVDLGSVGVYLREAVSYIERGDSGGAFSASARALAMHPDQPGIVADVARLLGRMGRSAEGEQLCKVFLLQRPESTPVQQALHELQPASS